MCSLLRHLLRKAMAVEKATADKSGGSRVSCGPRLAREGLEEVKKEGVGGGLKVEVRI